MYTLDGKWKIELQKAGLRQVDGKFGGGRMILLRATNITREDTFPLTFTGKVKSDGIITDRLKRQFGVLLPGETEEISLLKGTGSKANLHAKEHVVSIFFDSVALEFSATAMGTKFRGEIANRTDMFTKSILEGEGELPLYSED
ncbi:MAG: hypothetical protein CME84_14225 [Henriciella sp.]|nr:hypothetical protein [Henriciella sp.]MBF34393.1 hypothetical protein [Hyphomonadaceae bacterium]|tara:strand:+ start:1277 stop:1708 length:432 start_codon:yes stop_codon:yes gene_type:complete